MRYSLLIVTTLLFVTGCAVSADSKTEIAPYKIIESADNNIDLRTYESIILVSTPMATDKERDGAFMKLFRYISGDNIDQSKIAMTAPVFMDNDTEEIGKEIPMTAPVFMDAKKDNAKPMMSFVMPKDFTMETTPKPTNPEVSVSEVKDYTVAVIRFSGRLTDKNIKKHKDILEQWIIDNGHNITGNYQTAGYNAPYTLPAFRRNEVLIPVKINKGN